MHKCATHAMKSLAKNQRNVGVFSAQWEIFQHPFFLCDSLYLWSKVWLFRYLDMSNKSDSPAATLRSWKCGQTDAVTAWWSGLTDSSTVADKRILPLEASEPFSMCCQAVRTPASASLGWVAAWWDSAALEAANLAHLSHIFLLTTATTMLGFIFLMNLGL